MRYLLTVDYRSGVTDAPMPGWKPEEIKAYMDYDVALTANSWQAENTSTGTRSPAPSSPRSSPRTARHRWSRAARSPDPARCWPASTFDVDSDTRAIEIAGRISQVPGPGGTPLRQPIGVRRLMNTATVDPL
ncbi:hypothetical protein [Couchioplanes caeruleus]|uniref:Uncharacterized protein n=1 Tax=Couchioplanes caeruleus TaxID=56438 RepID=A0A3N1GGI8_9ACTN|nr:hypothetical protein [Couchioplanes caeruleus]ROP29392.1 hypothetical protein EDD30_2185 [Couchioplanes caeruleus]